MSVPPPNPAGRWRILLFYISVLALALATFFFVAWIGEKTLTRPGQPPAGAREMSEQIDTLLHVLLALAVIIVTARVVGALFRWFHQPPVIGEVVGGILLGPSLLGYVAPSAYAFLLPGQAAPFLGVIAQLGVILYMFLVGLHFDLGVLRESGHVTLAISHASIIVPFVLGLGLALGLYAEMAPAGVTFTSFALFIGVSMSITAFPVLARILGDRGLQKTRMGVMALTCAAIDDVTAWCLLAFVVSATQATRHGRIRHARPDDPLHRLHDGRRAAADCPGGAVAGRVGQRRRESFDHLRGPAAVGAGNGAHRHPCHLRRVSAGRRHAACEPCGEPMSPRASTTSSACCSCRRSLRSPGCEPKSGCSRASATGSSAC